MFYVYIEQQDNYYFKHFWHNRSLSYRCMGWRGEHLYDCVNPNDDPIYCLKKGKACYTIIRA